MITVAGFNSALDKYIEVDAIEIGRVARARNVQVLPGGKGAHVALALKALGEQVRLVAGVDTRSQQLFRDFFEGSGVEFHGVLVEGELRTCLAIRDDHGQLTEILEPGPEIGEGAARLLVSHFIDACCDTDVAVLSGSLPRGLPTDTYASLVRVLSGRSTRCVVDTSGESLRHAAAAGTFAIKPNRQEAEQLAGIALDDPEKALEVVRTLGARGITLVVVSLGPTGAVASWQGRTCLITAPLIQDPENTVGAGDCLVAGLAAGLVRGIPQDQVLALAVACGSAKVLCAATGLLRPEDVERLLPQVRVNWVDRGSQS